MSCHHGMSCRPWLQGSFGERLYALKKVHTCLNTRWQAWTAAVPTSFASSGFLLPLSLKLENGRTGLVGLGASSCIDSLVVVSVLSSRGIVPMCWCGEMEDSLHGDDESGNFFCQLGHIIVCITGVVFGLGFPYSSQKYSYWVLWVFPLFPFTKAFHSIFYLFSLCPRPWLSRHLPLRLVSLLTVSWFSFYSLICHILCMKDEGHAP